MSDKAYFFTQPHTSHSSCTFAGSSSTAVSAKDSLRNGSRSVCSTDRLRSILSFSSNKSNVDCSDPVSHSLQRICLLSFAGSVGRVGLHHPRSRSCTSLRYTAFRCSMFNFAAHARSRYTTLSSVKESSFSIVDRSLPLIPSSCWCTSGSSAMVVRAHSCTSPVVNAVNGTVALSSSDILRTYRCTHALWLPSTLV